MCEGLNINRKIMKKGWIYALFISGSLLLFSCGEDYGYEEGVYETTAGEEGLYETTSGEGIYEEEEEGVYDEGLNEGDEVYETTAGEGLETTVGEDGAFETTAGANEGMNDTAGRGTTGGTTAGGDTIMGTTAGENGEIEEGL